MAGPGVPAGVRVKQQATTVDLLPTVLALVGGEVPREVQGVSLAPALRGKEVPSTTYLETMFPRLNMGWAELRGIRTGRWKYLRAPRPELYDLLRDPAEANNVASAHAGEVKELEAQLQAVAQGSDKVEPSAVDAETLRQLRSLGYLGGGASGGQTEGPGTAADPKDRTEVLKLLHEAIYSGRPMGERIAMLRRAVAQDPRNPSLYSNLGDLYAQASRPAEAMKLYQSAINNGIRSAWLFSRMGQLCLRQGKKNDAIPFFEAAAQLNPLDYESLQNLSVAYRDTGRTADAEAILRSIVKSGESYAPAYNELGMLSFQKGDVGTARGYFEKAAELDPTYQLNLARLYKMQGETARARASFEAFLAARGSSPEYRDVVPMVRRELATVQ
jgi:tetratricopeptide (TPR) repeat protein